MIKQLFDQFVFALGLSGVRIEIPIDTLNAVILRVQLVEVS